MSHKQPWYKTLNHKQLMPYYGVGAVLVLTLCAVVFSFIITGKTRREAITPTSTLEVITTPEPTTTLLTARKLDGILVPHGQDALQPRAVMIDNQIDARPQFGIADANVVIEAPAEGGITRFLAIFDASSTVEKIGPVRSARLYYIEWAKSLNAAYFHVGGSPEAMNKLATTPSLINVDEIARGQYFWRAGERVAPHNVLTSSDRMQQAVQALGSPTSTITAAWRFKDAASSTEVTIPGINIPFGGSYNVNWSYQKDDHVYLRSQAKKLHKDASGKAVQADNVIVMKTDSKILDDKGRLQIRTTGSGDAFLYRDGNRYTIRWRRSPNEPLRFETETGLDVELNRGITWIEIVTDSVVFSGFQPKTETATSTDPVVTKP